MLWFDKKGDWGGEEGGEEARGDRWGRDVDENDGINKGGGVRCEGTR